MKIAVAADAANLSGERVKFGAVEQRLVDILSGRASLSQVPDTVRQAGAGVLGGQVQVDVGACSRSACPELQRAVCAGMQRCRANPMGYVYCC